VLGALVLSGDAAAAAIAAITGGSAPGEPPMFPALAPGDEAGIAADAAAAAALDGADLARRAAPALLPVYVQGVVHLVAGARGC
jgi:hypothetical protein